METYYITWWNAENLFDVDNAPLRPAYLQETLKHELAGWTQEVLDQKLSQIATIITRINSGNGPDVLGLCEVENGNVLNQLLDKLAPLGRNYGVAHHDTSDNRGIDIAFIFDTDLFILEEQFNYVVLKRSATRDIFQINMRSKRGNELIFIGNHWPARSGGQYPTEPFRMIAAETLSYWMERIYQVRGSDIPVIIMGDFNDECFNRSVMEYALGTNSIQKVINARSPRLYNLMWPIDGTGQGSFYYDNFPLGFDQFMLSKGLLLNSAPIKADLFPDGSRAKIELFEEMISTGDYEDPVRFGRPSNSIFNPETGYSDHYPVSMILYEE